MKGRSHILSLKRVFAFIFALYLLNFSIDSKDAHPDHIAEDLSYNDIESLVEFALEVVLGIENAVEEHEENDQDDGSSFEFKKFYCNAILVTSSPIFNAKKLPFAALQRNIVISDFIDINSPPPEV